ncbi:tetratricopeptide repeat protein [Caulobacter sp.]|uniref:tetratricopeptide repeat protein n=1 Tax=Caulobacter sp. TaxID=78 RepID=UPI001B066031|nr:tetratricopeptide repeat protein [Caulobacter sp.]MBO9545091.1 tetratricopeptide repeat protein [Caulobacter sp.]
MSRKRALEMSASALAQADVVGAGPIHAGQMNTAIGDSASNEALERLKRATQDVKNAENSKLLNRAIQAVHQQEFDKADKLALKLLATDDRLGLAWHVLAIAREKKGDYASSLRAYEAALALLTDHGSVAGDLGRLALRIGMPELAAGFFGHFRLSRPNDLEAANNLASALRELNRESEAIDVLKAAIGTHPESPALWNTLGTVICNTGDAAGSIVFFDEALRLDAQYSKALHNRAFAKSDMGDVEGALTDCLEALKRPGTPHDHAIMEFAYSTLLLAQGRLEEGWKAYEARFSRELTDAPLFYVGGARWSGQDLNGKHLLLSAEQGLGDEVMLANMLADTRALLGPEGKLTLGVEPRLIPLFQRSYPDIEVTRHRTVQYEGRVWRTFPEITDYSQIDYWAAMGDFLPSLRPTVESFPDRRAYLTPDPERVAHWKGELEKLGPSPKVGMLWKSANLTSERARQFSAFEVWEPVLKTPGVTFVNLQYGDCEKEIAFAKETFGIEIWQPPGIDLKKDLDDVMALCAAVDLVVGYSNATMNLAGAVGTTSFMLTGAASWTRLGTDYYPWYPSVRCFVTQQYGHWEEAMANMAEALADFVAE